MSEIVDIFKTPIYFKDLKLDTKSMRDYCLSLKGKNTSVVKSNVGGWQSDNLDGTHLIYGGSPDNDRLRGGRSRLIEVITVYWKSISKIGFFAFS